MIRRHVLDKPSEIERLDVFNDAKDTADWLRQMAVDADGPAALLMRTMASRLDERRRELARTLSNRLDRPNYGD